MIKPMATRQSRTPRTLTGTELEMMNIIWRIGPCSVGQILEELPADRALAYTSVSTIVRILEQKAFVRSQRVGRGHLYSALVDKNDYQARTLGHLVRNVFDDTPSLVVRQLLDIDALSAEDLQQIRALLRAKSKG